MLTAQGTIDELAIMVIKRLRFDAAQSLTIGQKNQAKDNLTVGYAQRSSPILFTVGGTYTPRRDVAPPSSRCRRPGVQALRRPTLAVRHLAAAVAAVAVTPRSSSPTRLLQPSRFSTRAEQTGEIFSEPGGRTVAWRVRISERGLRRDDHSVERPGLDEDHDPLLGRTDRLRGECQRAGLSGNDRV